MSRRVTWLGHASVLIEAGGARLLTDPVLRERVMHLRRHAAPAALPERVDAVLISHLHHDHADLLTLSRLPAGTRVIGPRGSDAALRRAPGAVDALRGLGTATEGRRGLGGAARGLRALNRAAEPLRALNVEEVEVGDTFEVGGLEVRVVHASHQVKRMPWGQETPALGFVTDGIYFPGDTDLFPEMAQLAPLELALLPVWGWGPTLGPGHLDPEEAARTLELLQPKAAIPIHWGTYLPYGLERKHGRLLHEPVADFRRHAERLAPQVRVIVPQVGVPIEL